MANYVIEGTVSELQHVSKKWTFKIAGTTGYVLPIREKKDFIKANVICKEDSLVKNNKKPRDAHILLQNETFILTDTDDIVLLALSLSNGKRCRFCFGCDENDFKIKNLRISSITLLAD